MQGLRHMRGNPRLYLQQLLLSEFHRRWRGAGPASRRITLRRPYGTRRLAFASRTRIILSHRLAFTTR